MPPKSRVTKSKSKSTRKSTKAGSFPALEKSLAETNSTASSASTMPMTTTPNPAASSSTANGRKDKGSVYFWKPNQDHGYLGQWYPSPFTVDGDTYATAEMWMMVQKARLFGDEDVAKSMLSTTDPKQHKALGRQVSNFNQSTWDAHKLRLVTEGNVHKFTISEDADSLRSQLLATGDRELVEASPMDRIWGIGFGEKKAGFNRHKWGQNLLGKALMDVRGRLREEGKGDGEKK